MFSSFVRNSGAEDFELYFMFSQLLFHVVLFIIILLSIIILLHVVLFVIVLLFVIILLLDALFIIIVLIIVQLWSGTGHPCTTRKLGTFQALLFEML